MQIEPDDLRSAVPDVRGEMTLEGLGEQVSILRDRWGIPYIRASSTEDAFFAQGFTHAQDRLWHMEYDRRRAAGRWAELVGETGVASDVLMRPMGVPESARRDYASLRGEARRMLDAFARGVNAFIDSEQPLPVEYELVGAEPEPWAPWDSIAVYKVRHVMMGPWEQKLFRAKLVNRVGPEKASHLFRGYVPGHPLIIPPEGTWAHDGLSDAVRRFEEGLEAVEWLRAGEAGSNSWVAGGSRTESQKPLLAGDPHRALDTPNAYYQNHIACPEFSAVGLSFPGVPGFPHFGHNADVAWCITHTGADTQDLFVERFHDEKRDRYLYDGAWLQAEVRREQIEVRGAESVELETVRTHHGPVLIGGPDRGRGLALRHTATAEADSTLNCFLPMLRAGSVAEFAEAMREWVDPCNNLLIADVQGDYGYRTRGKIPIRAEANAWLPVPGWDGAGEWEGYIPFEEMPALSNPDCGYLATANNRVVDDDYPYLISLEFSPGYRAERIISHLARRDDLTVEDMEAMHGDIVSLPARELLSVLSPDIADEPQAERARQLLRAWDGRMHRDRIEPTIYCALRDRIVDLVMRGLLGSLSGEILSSGRGGPRVLTRLRAPLLRALLEDDRSLLASGQSWGEVLTRALSEAVEDLEEIMGPDMSEWRWGSVHRVRPTHTLSGACADWAAELDPPDAGVHGDADVIHSASYLPDGLDFTVSSTSNARYIFDLSDWSRSRWIVPLGASGHPGSEHYADQQPIWKDVRTIRMLYTRQEIEEDAVTRQILRPVRHP